MTIKQSLENRIRGWFPQQPKFPKSSTKIDYQPLQREPWISRNRVVLGLIGGVLTVLISIGYIFLGLIFSDALRNYNIYATGELNPLRIAIQEFVLGGVGLATGILGIVGSKIGKKRGGILLIIAGAATIVLFSFFGVLAGILMLVCGATELGTEQWNTSKPTPHILSKERGGLLTFFLVAGMAGSILTAIAYIALEVLLLSNSTNIGDVISQLAIPLWSLTAFPILAIVNTCALFAIYRWRKWGFYALLASTVGALSLNIFSLGFHPEVIAGCLGIIIIYILLRPKWSLLEPGWPHLRSSLSFLLIFLAIFLLIASITPAAQAEDMLTLIPHGSTVAADQFTIDRQIPDTEIAANLTIQERLHFEIIIAKISPKPYGQSSVTFTISNQSLLSNNPKHVYFSNNQIGLPDDYYMFWSAPENGTYYFTLNYNYSGQNHISYSITKVWNTEETVQVVVYRPALAEYTAPALIVGGVLLATGAVTYHRKSRPRVRQSDSELRARI